VFKKLTTFYKTQSFIYHSQCQQPDLILRQKNQPKTSRRIFKTNVNIVLLSTTGRLPKKTFYWNFVCVLRIFKTCLMYCLFYHSDLVILRWGEKNYTHCLIKNKTFFCYFKTRFNNIFAIQTVLCKPNGRSSVVLNKRNTPYSLVSRDYTSS
jgi:hypothetical protein